MKYASPPLLSVSQKQALLELWNNEYPQNLKYDSLQALEDYLAELEDQNHILLLDDQDYLRGWYLDFLREDARWFIIILAAEAQGKKLGSQMLELAKQNHAELNGWVVGTNEYRKANGQPYRSPIDFYRKQGFEILHDVKLETDKIKVTKIYWSRDRERS